MRYKVTLSYDGSPFCGWQIQRGAPSVQECLQNALSTLLREEITVTGAGRTDSGVHAVGYVGHFDTAGNSPVDAGTLGYKLNAILPPQIKVHEVTEADPAFHARFDATLRTYRYFLHRCKDPFAQQYSWQCGFPLDVAKMNEAAAFLPGRRDFSCFEKTGGSNKTSICLLKKARWETYVPDHVRLLGYPAAEDDYLVFTVSADRFLRNMVRAIVGTLIDVGRGRKEPVYVQELLQRGSRGDAGESVPAHALFLCGIRY